MGSLGLSWIGLVAFFRVPSRIGLEVPAKICGPPFGPNVKFFLSEPPRLLNVAEERFSHFHWWMGRRATNERERQ